MRHKKTKHCDDGSAQQGVPLPVPMPVQWPNPMTNLSLEPRAFLHPFTMIVSGPTACGKSSWVKNLLQHSTAMISPAPYKIILCYRRWQPMYAEMAKTIPNLSFIQGVPDNLHDETFIDSRFPHLIIFDDLMKDATKSGEVCELYTEGAHHRNLSVISLMQNLFNRGKENKTMNLNSHYLVVFKNPRDRQQVAVLGQQMYPHRSSYFMEKFSAATSEPYGCLVVDLKQETPEAHRLRSGCHKSLNQSASSLPTLPTPAQTRGWLNQSASQGEATPTLPAPAQTRGQPMAINRSDALEPHSLPNCDRDHTSQDPQDTMDNLSCNECGVLFASSYMLHRHEETCPSETISEPERTIDDSGDESEDEGVWQGLVQRVYDELDDVFQKKVERLETSGMDDKEARQEASVAMMPTYRRHLIKDYKKILRTANGLEKSAIHKEIQNTIQWYLDKDYDFEYALNITMKKTRHLFDGVLDDDEDDDEDDGTDDEDNDNDDDNDNANDNDDDDDDDDDDDNDNPNPNPYL